MKIRLPFDEYINPHENKNTHEDIDLEKLFKEFIESKNVNKVESCGPNYFLLGGPYENYSGEYTDA